MAEIDEQFEDWVLTIEEIRNVGHDAALEAAGLASS
jgi:hypothetical protein